MSTSQACSLVVALALASMGAACSSGGYGSGGFGFPVSDAGPNFDGSDASPTADGGGAGGVTDAAATDAAVTDTAATDTTSGGGQGDAATGTDAGGGGVDAGTGGGIKGAACTPGGNAVCSQTGKEVLACSVQTNVYVVVETCEGWCTYEAGAAVCGFEEDPDVVVFPPDAGGTDAGVPEECSCPANSCGFLPGCPNSCGLCPSGQSCQSNVCTGGSSGGGNMSTATQLFEAWNACLSGACLQESGGTCASGDTACIQGCVQSANQTTCKSQFDSCSAYDLCPALASCISSCDSDQGCIQSCLAGTTGATCVELQCGQFGDACDNNSACAKMFDCFGECPDGSTPCVQACFDQAGPTAQGIYQQLVSCAQDAGCIN